MEKINWTSTKAAVELILFWWFMASLVILGTSMVVFAIFLVIKVTVMHVPSYIYLLAVLGIIIPGLVFKYFPSQEV